MPPASSAPESAPTALVKICGVTRRDQALEIAARGANLIGINLWEKSKRYLPLEKATPWMAEVPRSVQLVGVFVNPDPAYVLEACASGLFSYAQLHGDETPEYCASLTERGIRVLKAIQVRDEASLAGIGAFAAQDILLDAYHPQERGGIGETFPWELAVSFKRMYPERRLWLAGGLTAENVADAVRGVSPYAVDVASGVEGATPGVKDMEKVARFIAAAKRLPAG